MKILTNGDVIYEYPDTFGGVLVNGVDITYRKPIEVRYRKDGWGHVLVAYPEGQTEENLWNEGVYLGDNPRFSGNGKAGQPQNFTLKGYITVIPDWLTDGSHGHSSDNPTLVVN